LSPSAAGTAAKLAFNAVVTVTVTIVVALSLSRLRQGSIRVRGFGCEQNLEDIEFGCGGDKGGSEGVGFEGEVEGKRPE